MICIRACIGAGGDVLTASRGVGRQDLGAESSGHPSVSKQLQVARKLKLHQKPPDSRPHPDGGTESSKNRGINSP